MNNTDATQALNSRTALAKYNEGDRIAGSLTYFAVGSPWQAAFITCLVGLIAPGVALLEGNFNNPALSLTPLQDIGYLNQFILALPAFVYLAGAYFGAVPATFQQLLDSGVVIASREEWERTMEYAKRCLGKKVTLLAPYFLGFSFLIFSSPFLLTADTWFNIQETVAGLFVATQVFLLYYFASFVAVRIVIVYLVLRKIFELNVNIQPFHPDGCGGLRGLSSLSLRLSASTFVFGMIIVAAVYSNITNFDFAVFDVYNVLMLVGYFLVSSTAFFLPLYASRNRMAEAKKKLLDQIDSRFKKLNTRVTDAIDSSDHSTVATVDDLKAMKDLQFIANRMQVWPFNGASILKYFGFAVLPVLIMLIIISMAFAV